jgi:hypothetical protein
MRTAKTCGSGTRGWCQVGGGLQAPNRAMRATNPPAMEARGIRLQGERAISRKTIAQGMPECSSCTCMLVCALFALIAHETAGAASTRHSLRPLLDGRMILQTSGLARRENAETYLSTSSRPSEARAGTYNHECLCCATLQLQLHLQQASVAMGPCFRRDDAVNLNSEQFATTRSSCK